MRIAPYFTSVIIIASTLASCSDSSDEPGVSMFQNIVTFTGNGATAAYFEYQEYEDSPAVTLAVRGPLNEKKVALGTRLLMTYSLPADVKYGEDCSDVTLRGLQTIYTDTATTVDHATALAAQAPIYVTTLYRSGPYINLYCYMPSLPSRKYFIVADESSIGADTVKMYLSTRVPEESPTYNSTQVASIHLGELWTKSPTGQIFSLEVNNTNNVYRRRFNFTKQ